MAETETNCRNNNCYHFLVRRERMVETNRYFCGANIIQPRYPCSRLESVVVKFDAGSRTRRCS